MSSTPRGTPPGWLEALAGWALPSGLSGDAALGDLAEEYDRRRQRGAVRAGAWYALQVGSLMLYRLAPGRGFQGESGGLLADLRWSLRYMARHPQFTAGVLAVLVLGLTANITVFSVLHGTFQNTSWWKAPDRTFHVWPEQGGISFGQLDLYSREQSAYRTVGGYDQLAFALRTPDGESMSLNGVLITPSLFRELSAQPTLGRPLADEDARPGAEPVVVLSQDLWRRVFGGDPSVLGTRVDIGGGPVTVVGVQAAGARAPGGQTDLWLPAFMSPMDDDFWKARSWTMVGVLRDGMGPRDAGEELLAFADRLSNLYPLFYPPGFADGAASVVRADASQRRLISTPLLLLFGATALLLLATALNVGTLLLGRAVERRRELAVRAALGAGRGRLVRQLLAEAAMLGGTAVVVALWLADAGGQALARLFVGESVVVSTSVASPAVLLFALVVGTFAWAVLGGVPAAHFLRSVREGIQVKPNSGSRAQGALVTVQSSLATLLLTSALLLVATVVNLRQVPLGFQDSGLLTVALSPPEDRVATTPMARDLYDRLVARAQEVPGVTVAGITGWLPLRRQAPRTPVNLEREPVDPALAVRVPMHQVDPGFFDAMGADPLEGRLLDLRDRATKPSAVVVNQSLAELLWPGGNPVGERIAIDPHEWERWVPVVGVVPDIRSGELTGPTQPALYVSVAELPARDVTLVIRTSGESTPLASQVVAGVSGVDPAVPVRSATWMSDVVRTSYSTSWVVMGLLVALAVLATALGAAGVYAVLSHHVAAGRRDLGVRMALGAEPSSLVRRVVLSGLGLSGIGILAGAVAAALLARFLESVLFGISTLAPQAYLTAGLALLVATAGAAWIPAWRAGRTPPSEVLRAD